MTKEEINLFVSKVTEKEDLFLLFNGSDLVYTGGKGSVKNIAFLFADFIAELKPNELDVFIAVLEVRLMEKLL